MFEKINKASVEKGIFLIDSFLVRWPDIVHCLFVRSSIFVLEPFMNWL